MQRAKFPEQVIKRQIELLKRDANEQVRDCETVPKDAGIQESASRQREMCISELRKDFEKAARKTHMTNVRRGTTSADLWY